MKNYARFFGILGIIFIIFGSIGAAKLSGGGRSIAVLQALLGFLGIIFFLFYFLRETLSKISEEREMIFGIFGGIFLLLLLIGANVVSNSQWGERKFDLTTNKIYSLSPQTTQMIKNIKTHIAITAFFESGNRDLALLEDLVKKYTYINPNIKLTVVDPDREPALLKSFGASAQEVIVQDEETKRQFRLTNISEETLTITIKRVINSESKTIYFMQGQGEGELESDKPIGMYIAKVLLENEGFTVKPLILSGAKEIPTDAKIIAAWGADRPFSETEIALLSNYIDRGGSVVIGQGPILAPTKNRVLASGLEPLLAKVGLEFKPSVLLGYQIDLERGKIINSRLPATQFEKHTIVANLANQGAMEIYFSQPIVQIPNFKNENITRDLLVSTPEDVWAETDISSLMISRTPSPKGDPTGPFPIGQVAELKVSDAVKDRFSSLGKVIVFGDSSFGTNKSVQRGFNRDIFLNTFNFAAGENNTLSIRPKTWSQSTLQMSEETQGAVNFASLVLLPELILIFGVAVWLIRRSY